MNIGSGRAHRSMVAVPAAAPVAIPGPVAAPVPAAVSAAVSAANTSSCAQTPTCALKNQVMLRRRNRDRILARFCVRDNARVAVPDTVLVTGLLVRCDALASQRPSVAPSAWSLVG
jgi:hypothetical protein